MKKNIFITSLLILIVNLCYSQNELNGIFKIRLGMTEEEIREVVDTSLLTEDIDHIYTTGEGGILGDRIKAFILKRYSPAYNYTIEHIVLYFADDKLYMIRIFKYNPKIEYLITRKYGMPKIAEDIGILDKKGREIIKRWETNNEEIACKSTYYPDANENNLQSYSLIIANMVSILPMLNEYLEHAIKKEEKIKERSNQELLDAL